MQLVLKTISCFVLLFLSSMVLAQDKQFHHEIEKIIKHETVIDFRLVPTIIILSYDRPNHFASQDTFGVLLPDDTGDVNPTTWELGSLTKPFIAYLAQQALRKLNLGEDSPVCSVLPDTLCHDEWASLTFRQLLEHRAGLPLITSQMAKAENDVQDPYKDYSLANLQRDILEVNPNPGQYSYSHLGYAALYWLFEKVGGLKTYALKQFPIGGTTVWLDTPDPFIVPGYGLNGKPAPCWHANALAPAVGLQSDMYSVYQFICRWFPGGGDAEGVKSSPGLFHELDSLEHKKEFKVVDGWYIFRSGKSIVYYQNGHTGRHSVSVAFIPEESRCVIIFANGAAGTQDLSLLILDMLRRGKKK